MAKIGKDKEMHSLLMEKSYKLKKTVVLSNYHRAVVKYLMRPQSLLGAELEGYVRQMLCTSHFLVGKALISDSGICCTAQMRFPSI